MTKSNLLHSPLRPVLRSPLRSVFDGGVGGVPREPVPVEFDGEEITFDGEAITYRGAL